MGCSASHPDTDGAKLVPHQPKSPVSTPPAAAASAPSPPASRSMATALPAGSKVVFVLGGPGSGKGTQCEKIIAEYEGVKHLSAGDLLRDAVKNGNSELEAIMKEGKLVPMEVTISLLKDAMIASGSKTFLIDGFPRAWDQAEAFEAGIQPCEAVLFFDCSEQVMRERLLERGKTSGRADDNESTIVKRFHTFVEQSKPVVDKYAAMGKVHDISAMRSPDEVFADVKTALDFHLRGIPLPGKAVAPAAPKKLPDGSKIIFVLGGPGAGKGTQCEKILAEYKDIGVQHLSAGDLLRDAVKNDNTELEAIMKEGKLVPMDVTISLLKDAMIASGAKTFLIDGFPRAWDQAEAFEAGIQPCEAVLFFDCSEQVMRERLLERGKTSGRADDNESTIVKRFHTFVEQSKPVVAKYATMGKVHDISAMRSPDDVFVDVKAALDYRLRGVPMPTLPPAVVPAIPDSVADTLPDDSKIIFVLGGPGSGKGTQCDLIKAKYTGVHHLSAGDLLRDAVKNGNTELEAIMKEGKLVPMDVTIGLLKASMIASGAKTFLIDGFPRAVDQAAAFVSQIMDAVAVLFFDCSEEAMRDRLLERGKTSGRADDNEETIIKRFRTFVEQSKPVVEEYKAKGKVFEISSMQTPEEVFAEVCAALDPVLA